MAFNQLIVHPFQSFGFNCQPAPLHRGALPPPGASNGGGGGGGMAALPDPSQLMPSLGNFRPPAGNGSGNLALGEAVQASSPRLERLKSTARFQSLIVKKDDGAFNFEPLVLSELAPLHVGPAPGSY